MHEFAHAAVAYLQGDATAKLFGRLTLNPIVHFDPVGGLMTAVSVLFTGFIIGWAKPTPVNPANLHDRRNGEVLVALAGPASNFLMALAAAVVFRILDAGVDVGLDRQAMVGLRRSTTSSCTTSLLAIFNFIPVPPLDGSALLYRILTPRQAWQIRPFLTQYGIFVVLAVVLLVSRPLSEPHLSGSPMSWWASKARQFQRHLTARVRPAERAALAAWLHPPELELFDAHARRRPAPWAGRRRRPAPIGRDGPRRAGRRAAARLRQGQHRRRARGSPGRWARRTGRGSIRVASVVPGWGAALVRLRDHAEASAALVEAAGLPPFAADLVRYQAEPRDPEYGRLLQLADEAA